MMKKISYIIIILFLITNVVCAQQKVKSQIPEFLQGTFQVVNPEYVDRFEIEGNYVNGYVGEKQVSQYVYEKKEDGFYYLNRMQNLQKEKTNTTIKGVERKAPEGLSLVSPNQITSKKYIPNIKVRYDMLENKNIELKIYFLSPSNQVINSKKMTIRKLK